MGISPGGYSVQAHNDFLDPEHHGGVSSEDPGANFCDGCYELAPSDHNCDTALSLRSRIMIDGVEQPEDIKCQCPDCGEEASTQREVTTGLDS